MGDSRLRGGRMIRGKKKSTQDFPGGSVVKNQPVNAGDMGSIPSPKYPAWCRATKPCAATTEPMLWSLGAATTEPGSCNYWACIPQLLSPCTATTKPGSCNYWARELQLLSLCTATSEPGSCNYWACVPQLPSRVPQLLSLCTATTEPGSCNYWARILQLLSPHTTTTEPAYCNYWAHVQQLLSPHALAPVFHNKRRHRSEKPAHCN